MTLQIILTLAGYFVFSAAVGAMAAPTEAQKGGWYGWLYRFLQRLAANADRLAEAKFGFTAGGAGEAETNVAGTVATRTAITTSRESVSLAVSNGASKDA